MYKMLFDTGVKPYNRLNLSGPNKGKFELRKWEVLKGGQIHIEYYLEHKPEKGLRLLCLCSSAYLEHMRSYERAIKIVDGGMFSEYAIFMVSE